jgi:glycosyltransferase involved in cell wall biosynthesis
MNSVIEILLATYNGEKFLKEQIESIFSKSSKDIHLIIRDDGSTDNTLEIIHEAINKFPNQITLIDDRSHRGVIGSFSQLLETSKSPYVMFADQDDIWLDHKIDATFQKMQEMEKKWGKEKPILVHSDLTVVNEKLEKISHSYWTYTRIKPQEGSHLNRLLVQNEITGCTIMMNRPLVDLASPIFPESVMHDWWIALIAAAFGHIGVIGEPLILYRQHKRNTLGANKFGKLKLKNLTINQSKKMNQASELLKRFSNKLTPENQKMLDDYISMKDSSFLRNRFITLKYRFFKQGLLRNLFYFLLMRHP